MPHRTCTRPPQQSARGQLFPGYAMSAAPDLFALADHGAPRGTASSLTGKRARIPFIVHDGDGSVRQIEPVGRDAWALGELILAGVEGCTPIDQPGPRWSHYVWKLRTVHGLNVETITEGHGGEFSGTYARYVLRQRVQFADPADRTRAAGDAQ
jgi:hypothetical protein